MPAPAANIDQAISFAANYVAQVAYGTTVAPTKSLSVQFGLWIAGLFSEATGIFKPSSNEGANPGQKVVTDWYAQHILARQQIASVAVGAADPVGVGAVVDVLVRVLYAVKFGTTNANITSAQQTAVVTLFNTVWA